MKRKKTALALSLTIPLLLEGASPAGATESYPPGTPPATPGPQTPPTGPPGPGLVPDLVPDRTGPAGTGLPVTGGDLAGLAVAGAGALVVGFGLNSAAGRRRYGVLEPFSIAVATGPSGGWPPTPADPVGPDHRPSTANPPERETEGSTVSMYEQQFRIAPEALERDDLLEGLEGQTRERLAAVLHSAATSYRATLEELEAARSATPGAGPGPGGEAGSPADRFAELGEHVAWVLRASHDAAEEERRRAREEVELARSEALADLTRRREEVDELERRAAERLRLADEEAAATLNGAREEAERQAGTIRAEAETQLSSLLQLQESLRVQLVEASQELRRSLDSLGASDVPEAPVAATEASAPAEAPSAAPPTATPWAWTPEPGPSASGS